MSRLSSETTVTSFPSEEMEKLKEELAAAQKEVEDLRTRTDMADSFAGNNTEEGAKSVADQVAEQVAERVAAMKADLEQREAKVAGAEQKMANVKAKANEMVRAAKDDKSKLQAELTDELNHLRQQLESASSRGSQLEPQENTAMESTAPESEMAVKVELPGPGASDLDIKHFVSGNPVVQAIIKRTVANQVQRAKTESEKKTETEKTETAVPEATGNADTNQQIFTKAEHDKITADKVEQTRAQARLEAEKRYAAKESLAKGKFTRLKVQWDVVELAARETPEKPVKEVYEVAKETKPPPNQPANTPATPQALTQSFGQAGPAQSQQSAPPVTAPASSSVPQINGARANSFGQPSIVQPAFGQPGMGQAAANPFAQSSSAGQHFLGQAHNQMGQGFGPFSGLAQPGFASSQNQQPQFNQNQGRPNSPFGQQQPQQGGRGRGNFGTGPAALRDIVGQGQPSNIPRPGGRGQSQQNQLAQNANAPGAQMGRGGGRGGGGRSRGQGQSMNPGAPDFQPGGGRGQKRGAEDDGGGSHRGGKRARGGRGGGDGEE